MTTSNRNRESIPSTSRTFRHELDHIELLSYEEVVSLALRKARGQAELLKPVASRDHRIIEEGERAQQHLIEANMRLVSFVAQRYRSLDIDFMDLVQEGMLGLMRAVQKFDHRKGHKFSTYAIWWIRQYIARFLMEQVSLVHVPQHRQEQLMQLARVQRRLQQALESEPTAEELAGNMDMSVQQVINLFFVKKMQAPLSLNSTSRVGDEDLPLSDLLEDDAEYLPEQVVFAQTLQAQIRDMLKGLKPLERAVLQLRYGLNGYREHTLHQAGRRLDISHEAVRQIERRALRRLVEPCRQRDLAVYL